MRRCFHLLQSQMMKNLKKLKIPGVILPITVGRDKSMRAINKAHESNKFIAVLTQIDSKTEDPNFKDLYHIGTIARIVKLLRMPDGSQTIILQGRKRFVINEIISETNFLECKIQLKEYIAPSNNLEYEAMIKSIQERSKKIIELNPQIPNEAQLLLRNINNDRFLLNFISSNINIAIDKKQALLEQDHLSKKAESVLIYLDGELQLLEVKDQTENKKWSKEVRSHFDKELQKMQRMNPQVGEYSVQMNYLELLVDLPWGEFTEDKYDLKEIKSVLDKDHHGLEKVKERVLEHLAVLKLKGDMKAPILCLVGPPGVGKTSLGKSIATSIGRNFIRMSLGGLHDESEIRGHRKTYIGAMPGRIIQSIRKAKSSNPVFILDEIDKIGKDFRGDPSSALLEVLDPEQNSTFHDNYLDIEFDLSKVMFIATANSLSTIQPALLDRMEIIELQGYSIEEKVDIAAKHLIPKQITEHGLKPKQVKIPNAVVEKIIQEYTRESGVRSLDRQIASLARRAAKKIALEESQKVVIENDDIKDILGIVKYNNDLYQENLPPGVAIGLAWTRVGGDILYIETSISKGKGKLTLTGNLGDVMKESATTALTFIKSHSEELGITADYFENHDFHVHVPEGAIPKDGPSAGITMLSALSSAIKNKPIKTHLAMTGEITLRGKVLPVGGIKEKILAAKRAGITQIMLCKENKDHVDEVPSNHLKGLKFKYVETMKEVLEFAIGLKMKE